jgi:hypothetical protein
LWAIKSTALNRIAKIEYSHLCRGRITLVLMIIMLHAGERNMEIYSPKSIIFYEGNVVIFAAVLSIKTAFNLIKIHLLFRSIPSTQWSVMFCRPCFNRFWGLKYIPRLFSEYMLTIRVEEPMKICVTNSIRNIHIYPRFENNSNFLLVKTRV